MDTTRILLPAVRKDLYHLEFRLRVKLNVIRMRDRFRDSESTWHRIKVEGDATEVQIFVEGSKSRKATIVDTK